MGKLMADLGKEGDILNKKTAKKFIKSLFEELNVPMTREEINIIIKYCASEDKTISKTNFQSIIIRLLPKSEYDVFNKCQLKKVLTVKQKECLTESIQLNIEEINPNISILGCGPGIALFINNFSQENAHIIALDGRINIKCKNPIVQLACVDESALFLDSSGYIHKINCEKGSQELGSVLDIPVLVKSIFTAERSEIKNKIKSYLIGFDDNLWEMNFQG